MPTSGGASVIPVSPLMFSVPMLGASINFSCGGGSSSSGLSTILGGLNATVSTFGGGGGGGGGGALSSIGGGAISVTTTSFVCFSAAGFSPLIKLTITGKAMTKATEKTVIQKATA